MFDLDIVCSNEIYWDVSISDSFFSCEFIPCGSLSVAIDGNTSVQIRDKFEASLKWAEKTKVIVFTSKLR
jgi:hypothetical protein